MNCLPLGQESNALLAVVMIIQYVGCAYLLFLALRSLRAPLLRLLGDSHV